MTSTDSTRQNYFVGNGRVSHAGTSTETRGYTVCGAEGRRSGGGHNLRPTDAPVTCGRCKGDGSATTRVAAAKAPVQTEDSIRASRVRAAVAYRDDYRAMIRGIEARGEVVPEHLHAQVAKFQARIDENGGEQ